MERNWLIRTSQDQILGPVAKQKLLEFIQKGALGMTDEVCSGNGYWFSLKEKELVEKYLYGDIPQSYNPISESRSVLAKRDHPEKTTSINTAPANKTQIMKVNMNPGIIPNEDDLAFPDITMVQTIPLNLNDSGSDLKLPSQDDLAFPDLDSLTSITDPNRPFVYPSAASSPSTHQVHTTVVTPKVSAPAPVTQDDTEAVLPNEDDLAFPDMDDFFVVPKAEKVERPEVDMGQQFTQTVALDSIQTETILSPGLNKAKISQEIEQDDFGDFSLALDQTPKQKTEDHNFPEEPSHPPLQIKKERPQPAMALHDRKTKSSVISSKSAAAQRDPNREVAHANSTPEPLKKRNDNYLFFILIIVVMIIIAVFFYFKEILNKPLPV